MDNDTLNPQLLPQIQIFKNILGSDYNAEYLESSHSFMKMMAYYKCALMEIETKFNVLNVQFSMQYDKNPISTVKTRLKNPESIFRKLEKKGLPISLASVEENLYDVAGIRVICPFVRDVYMLEDALLRQDDIILIQRKDYIATPKPNGYRSLHLIVSVPIFLADEKRQMTVEIQLRTIAMDCWASLEHQLRYKKDTVFTEEMSEELNVCAELSAELDMRMNALRDGIGISKQLE